MTDSKEGNYIGYSGAAKITAKKGKAIIWEKTAHNSGKKNLFKFMATALTGELNKQLLPKMIRLFGKTTPTETVDSARDESTWQFTEQLAACPLIHIGSAGVAESSEDGAQTSLTFRIPGAMISGEFCKLALYPIDPSDPVADALAVIGLTKENEEGEVEWAPESVSGKGDQSLEIEWTLTIQNAE